MIKIISTKEQISISLVGPSGFEQLLLVFGWLKNGTFRSKFDKVFSSYQHYQPFNGQMQGKNHKLIEGVDFELIENLPYNGKRYLIKIDDSCE